MPFTSPEAAPSSEHQTGHASVIRSVVDFDCQQAKNKSFNWIFSLS